MKNISTHARGLMLSLLAILAFIAIPSPVSGQGCNQVDIKFEQPACYNNKGSGSASPANSPCIPVTVCEKKSYTYTADGGPWSSYLWVISSGPASPAINPSPTAPSVNITWPLQGTYILTLTVTDALGNVFTKCLEITVKEKPVAGFTFSPNNACAPILVSFTNTTSFSGTAFYSWNFGDPASGAGNSSNLPAPTHLYNTSGTYTVTLIAFSSVLLPGSGSNGTHGDSLTMVTCCADTIKKTVTVLNGNVKIECVSTVCAGAIVKYTAVGCTSPTWGTPIGGTILSTAANTITVQWGSGNPQGQLSVTCGGGCTAYATVPIVPVSPVISGPTNPCTSGVGTYTLPYLPGTYYTWTLTDITTSTLANSLISTYPDNNVTLVDWSLATSGDTYQLNIALDNKHLCCSSAGSLTITPKGMFSIVGPNTICAGNTGGFFPIPSGTFNWASVPPTGVVPPSASSAGSYAPVFNTAGSYVITAMNTLGAFCNTMASASVKVVALPVPGVINGPTVACTGRLYSYSMSTPAPAGYYYDWTVTNGLFQPTATSTTTGDNVTIQWSSLSGTISVVLRQSAAPACSAPAPSITVNAATPGTVTGTDSVCVDGTGAYTLAGGNLPSGTVITWSISPPALGTITGGQGTGSITILWHGTGGPGPWGPATVSASTGCGNATPKSGILIFPKFTMSITSAGVDVCTGAGISLTANGAPPAAAYTWSPGGATTQTINGVTTPGTYTVSATKGGCSAFAQINVPDPFQIVPVTCGVGVCNGSSTNEPLGVQVIKPASGTFTYEWHSGTCTSPGPILATTTTTSLSNNFTAPSDGNYCIIVKYGNCQKCLNFIVKKVCCPDVNTPSITNTTQLTCDQYSFTGTTPNPGGATITWSFGDGTTAAGASGVPITHTYATAGIYCVTFCVGPTSPNPTNCTGNCAATTAVVPIAAAFSYTLGCNGCLNVTNLSSVFVNPSLVTYLWNFGDASPTSTLQSPPQHCYANPGTHIVTLTVSYNGAVACSKTAQQTTNYIPLSIATIPACSGSPISFSSNPGGFVSYAWSFGDGFTGYTSPIQHTYIAAGTHTVSLSVTDALGNTCTANNTFNIAQGIDSCKILPAYICPGSAAILTAPAGTYTYLWQQEISPNVYAAAPGVNNAGTYTTTVPGNYRVIITDGSGCTCTTNTVPVVAAAKPRASFSISPSKLLCASGIVSLTAPFVSGFSYDWYLNGSYGSPVSSGSAYVTIVSSTTTFSLIITNQYGCKDTCTQTVTVNTPPAPPVVTKSGNCEGVLISLAVTNYSNNITWNSGATTTSIVVYTAGSYIATYLDTATGCSSSTTVTINRRPSAGLFPHYCDSIPCKCIRPFVLYPPKPLTGLFASNYIINWYNANTNSLLFTGTPYNSGGLGVQTGSYYIVITDQTTGCKDTSNVYSIVVPPCDSCDCKKSQWGEMNLTQVTAAGGGTSITVKCKKEYTIECNKPYSLSAYYNCKDTACKGIVKYKLQPPSGTALTGIAPVNFTPILSGTYVLTLYGYCGDRPCDSCVITFIVNCHCSCDGSKWAPIVLTQSAGATDGGTTAVTIPTTSLSCKGNYKLDCNKPYTVSGSYICKDSNCTGKATYSLLPPIGAALTGTGALTFTPTQTGTYVLTLYGYCGDKICDSCVIKFTVTCGCDCSGSKWGDISLISGDIVNNPNAVVTPVMQALKCNGNYKLDCNSPYSLTANYFCKDSSCKGNATYSLQPPAGTPITGTMPFSFTPTVTGSYVLTLYGYCGNNICDSCVIRFDVICDCDCKGSKWGDKTLSNGNTSTTLACKSYEWKCNTPFIINASYACALSNCSSAGTYKLIPAIGSPVTGTLPLSYTPVQSGLYTVVTYGLCGNKVCDSCVTSFKVDCPRDTTCCKTNFTIDLGTPVYTVSGTGNATIADQTVNISGYATAQLTEVRAEVLSFTLSSSYNNECLACKNTPFTWASINTATNIGPVPPKITLYGGATTSTFNPSGTAVYQNPREVIWNNGTTFSITGPFHIKYFLPPPPLISCCDLRGIICVKFRFRDINCDECEATLCFEVVIKK